MKKNNYGKLSLLLLSAMMALSTNSATAIDQPPTSVSSSTTVNTGVTNASLVEYYVQNDVTEQQVGGGIYNVTSTGALNISTTSNVVYQNIAAMVNLPLVSDPSATDKVGRFGGVIYNAGDLYIGSQVNGGTVSATGFTTTFSGNVGGQGGAIENFGNAYIYNAIFNSNIARDDNTEPGKFNNNNTGGWDVAQSGRGGAIANFNTLSIVSSKFEQNSGKYGGAIYNGNGGEITLTNSDFTGNSASNQGGAIYNNVTASSPQAGTVTVNGGTFDGNYAANGGGAIYNLTSDGTGSRMTLLNVDSATFKNNATETRGMGGAIYNGANTGGSSRATIVDTTFENNGILRRDADNVIATGNGGAIYNASTLTVDRSRFTGNKAVTNGGAIYNRGEATITDTQFSGNGGEFVTVAAGTETTQKTIGGGAIYNNGTLNVDGGSFTNNSATEGGAVYNNNVATLTDTYFSGNSADKGGALYGANNSTTTVIAQDSDVNFATASDTIWLTTGNGTDAAAILNLNANENRNINLNGAINSDASLVTDISNVPVININYNNANYTGNVNFDATVSGVNLVAHAGTAKMGNTVSSSTVTTQGSTIKFLDDKFLGTNESKLGGHTVNNVVLNGGTLDIQQGVVSNIALNSINLMSDTNLKVDVDVVNEVMDNITEANIGDSSLNSFTSGANINISDMRLVNEGYKESANILFTDVEGLSTSNVNSSVDRVEGAIYKYAVEKKSRADIFGSSGNSSVDDDVFFQFNNLYEASDNATAAPVAQIGAFLMMDNIYRQSFANMDMLSILTRDERETLKRYNRYSNMFDDEINTFYQDKRQEDYPSVFARPFTNLERVRLKRGPRVSNVFYGTLIGHESGLYELGRGWDANYAVFGAYTGAHQTYNGIGVWQNGGSVGGVFTAYKGDFWAGLTANVGGWAVEASNDFGNEHFPMLGTGVAMKTGYNIRMFDNKFILQPSYMMSYTFIYAYSHDNAAGVHIKQDPLHALEFIPGVKLIANNFRNGWQPYLAVNMTWMCIEGARFWAGDAAFDSFTIKPFVEYGLGIQKHHGERATGFLQAMVRNGGRTGVALTGGFRWAIGEDIID